MIDLVEVKPYIWVIYINNVESAGPKKFDNEVYARQWFSAFLSSFDSRTIILNSDRVYPWKS